MSEFVPETEPTQQDPMQGFGGGASMSVPSSPLPSGPAEAPVSDRAKRAAARLAREREQSRESSPARGAEGARGAAGAPATKATRSVSPDPDLDSLPPARLLFHDALRGVSFGPEQYWRAYCDLHRAALYGDKSARARVECSRLGAVLATHFRLDLGVSNAWDSSSTRRLVTSAVLPGMATFVHATHGHRWTRLRNLIEAFDDADALAKDPAGFGAHVLEDARTQEEDEAGASAFADGTAK
jgi:hypothetical protein